MTLAKLFRQMAKGGTRVQVFGRGFAEGTMNAGLHLESDPPAKAIVVEISNDPEIATEVLAEDPTGRVKYANTIVRLSGTGINWVLVRAIWLAIEALWPTVAYDEVDGFDITVNMVS
ncbi:hypothetical protein [Kibdelosporangium philippinense]|uniref:hypothetical protein n=1 Tax=Kibdelosporangium philippinense TaxID=211113 RepID=UPI0035EDEC0D